MSKKHDRYPDLGDDEESDKSQDNDQLEKDRNFDKPHNNISNRKDRRPIENTQPEDGFHPSDRVMLGFYVKEDSKTELKSLEMDVEKYLITEYKIDNIESRELHQAILNVVFENIEAEDIGESLLDMRRFE